MSARLNTVLLEIGCEEIPAQFLARAIAALPGQVAAAFVGQRLGHGKVEVMGTPRRLAVLVHAVDERQADLREQVVGPAANVAFDAAGALTKAGLGFAQKQGLDPATIRPLAVPGKKGEYAVAERFVKGSDARQLMAELLNGLIRGIAWPKSMRWGWDEETYVRPLQWLVALWDNDIIPVTWGRIVASATSRGHRFLAPGPVAIAHANDYVSTLARSFVIVQPSARKDAILAELMRVEAETGARIRHDDGLLAEVVNLVEYPVAIAGGFAEHYLQVPEEIIVTAMRNHQRYFAMSKSGRLTNRFVTIAGTVVADARLVQAGNERVLAARLADASFFVVEDQKKSMDAFAAKLDHVVFQAGLGEQARTTGAKVRRIVSICESIAPKIRVDREAMHHAARWSKADLMTGAVGEFPELQGIMGMHYAKRELSQAPQTSAIASLAAVAIAEQYLPKGQGSALPTTLEGVLLGLADRMDTLVGCFAIGAVPSGSADPFGLRRAAIGVLSLLLDRGPGGEQWQPGQGFPLSIQELVDTAGQAYGETLAIRDGAKRELTTFLATRLRGMLVESGLGQAEVDAAMAISADDPCDVRARASAITKVPSAARAAFKRIANILDDAAQKALTPAANVDPSLFVAADNVEWQLHRALETHIQPAEDLRATGDFFAVIDILSKIEATVAAFFDKGGVMVMDPDRAIAQNRLALLARTIAPFAKMADFRLLAGVA